MISHFVSDTNDRLADAVAAWRRGGAVGAEIAAASEARAVA
jgi:hypothetical protein